MSPCVFNPFSIIPLAPSPLEICLRGKWKLLMWLTVSFKNNLIKPRRQPHIYSSSFFFLFYFSFLFYFFSFLSPLFLFLPRFLNVSFLFLEISLSTTKQRWARRQRSARWDWRRCSARWDQRRCSVRWDRRRSDAQWDQDHCNAFRTYIMVSGALKFLVGVEIEMSGLIFCCLFCLGFWVSRWWNG